VKLFSKYSNLCKNIPKYHRRTDRQSDGRTTYCGITALCVASRGIKAKTLIISCCLETVRFHCYLIQISWIADRIARINQTDC